MAGVELLERLLGDLCQWALSRGPGSVQQPPMGDLSVAVTGQKAESAIILTAQVKILSLLTLYIRFDV